MRRLLSRAGNLVIYRKQLEFLYDFRMRTPGERPELPPGASFEFPCETSAMQGWTFESGQAEQDHLRGYMAAGDQLAVIRYGNEVACRGLVRTRGRLVLEGQRQARSLREGEAFIHYCRTSATYAGRSLYPHMLRRILWNLAQQYDIDDITKVTITCRDDNIPSIKGIERAGFTLKRRLQTVGFLGGRIAHTWHTELH